MRPDRFPLTYDECRERFRWSVANAGATFEAHPIAVTGTHGQELTIDVCSVGTRTPERALLVLAGVHGDEGFSSSTLMCDAIDRWVADGTDAALADDAAIVLIHGVNPWGMSYWRRQNESNVDLNRNWGRDERVELPSNPGYAELHPHLVPVGDRPPTAASLLDVTRALVDERGYAWVKSAVSEGSTPIPTGCTSVATGPRSRIGSWPRSSLVASPAPRRCSCSICTPNTGRSAPTRCCPTWRPTIPMMPGCGRCSATTGWNARRRPTPPPARSTVRSPRDWPTWCRAQHGAPSRWNSARSRTPA